MEGGRIPNVVSYLLLLARNGVLGISGELREFFNYATSLVIMLSLYMFQFTMLFTS